MLGTELIYFRRGALNFIPEAELTMYLKRAKTGTMERVRALISTIRWYAMTSVQIQLLHALIISNTSTIILISTRFISTHHLWIVSWIVLYYCFASFTVTESIKRSTITSHSRSGLGCGATSLQAVGWVRRIGLGRCSMPRTWTPSASSAWFSPVTFLLSCAVPAHPLSTSSADPLWSSSSPEYEFKHHISIITAHHHNQLHEIGYCSILLCSALLFTGPPHLHCIHFNSNFLISLHLWLISVSSSFNIHLPWQPPLLVRQANEASRGDPSTRT